MSVELIVAILLVGLILLLALGVEIAVAVGVLASLGLVYAIKHPQVEIAWTAWLTMNSFTIMAMPLFIFMGTLFANTGVIRGLFEAADKWIGGLTGGLASSVILANAIFGAMSGSSIAAAATFTTLAFPEMERRGYERRLGLGAIAMGGTLSVLIPPSIVLIIYGSWQNISVAQLFAAALIPGAILAVLLTITVVVLVKLDPSKAPKSPGAPWSEKLRVIKDMLPWAGIIILVLGVIFMGIMTPTEASALGAFLSIVVAFAYRQMTYKAFRDSFFSAVRVTAMIAFVLASARMLSFVLQDLGVTTGFAEFMLDLPFGRYIMLTLICVMYLVLGMFFDAASMLVLTIPFVFPIILGLNFDPVWWGVVYVLLAEIGLVTPPFGLNLFAIHGVSPKHSILVISVGVLPFFIPTLIMVALLTAFPDLALWLPSVLY